MKQNAIILVGSQDANTVCNFRLVPRVRSLTAKVITVDVVDMLRWGRTDRPTYVGWR